MEIILTHENGDFDGVAGVLAASKLYPDALPVLPERLNQNVSRFITLYANGLPFVRQSALRPRSVKRIILVDTQRLIQMKSVRATIPVEVIDHHPLSQELPSTYNFSHELVGAVTTLLVEKIRSQGIALTSLEATLLLLGIYEDTGSLIYGTTTPRDLWAAGWLLEQGAGLDTVRRFLTPPLNDEQQSLLEQLIKQVETRSIEGYSISMSVLAWSEHISEVSNVTHRLRDLLDSAALFVIVAMPTGSLVVARSVEDGVDVGEIARLLGGGGHGRAAAATVRDRSLSEITSFIWDQLAGQVQPAVHVADLMSHGVQTVEAAQSLSRVMRQLRQIGHEGYPVTDKGKLVGLLTRRDLDRADELGMRDLTVQDVMTAGEVKLQSTESIFDLERKMQESGWGQIPVEDASGKLSGIVTRTDLIKHWLRRHPSAEQLDRSISPQQIETMLGHGIGQAIQRIADFAQDKGVALYLVGGVVRDLLLGRSNFDIDFVVEGDAIQFATALQQRFGGHITAFKPFGTAKWQLAGTNVVENPSNSSGLPDHIDFASSRYEFYEYPTALPIVYNSSIKLDLQRRDFTINTLAVQLSRTASVGRVLDFFGGLRDLDKGVVCVLHSLSFIDDPTRILRAARFENRLNFTLEPRTAELMTTALPMLERITGERLRNEFDLLLHEREPERGLLALEQRGVLAAIHPALKFDDMLAEVFSRARQAETLWLDNLTDWPLLYWHIWAAMLPIANLQAICQRLLIAGKLQESLLRSAQIVADVEKLTSEARPSQIVSLLSGTGELELLAAWLVIENPTARENTRRYWQEWREIQPVVSGSTLRDMGLPPGPCYSKILKRLRDARLDGDVHDEAGERGLLDRLLKVEGICEDNE